MPEPGRVLITGAAGALGSILRRGLAGRPLTLVDRRPIDDVGDNETAIEGELATLDEVRTAADGVDAIVHLAGEPTETRWADIVAANIEVSRRILAVAAEREVRTVVLASSNHAVGYLPVAAAPIPADAPPEPDSFYGWSKASVELLAKLYHRRHGLDVSCLRIGRCTPTPRDTRALINWLSPADAVRLFRACLTPRPPGFRTIWAVSANTRGVFDLTAGEAVGYFPEDDAEKYAADVIAQQPGGSDYLGGHFTSRALGWTRPNS